MIWEQSHKKFVLQEMHKFLRVSMSDCWEVRLFLKGQAFEAEPSDWDGKLCRTSPPSLKEQSFKAIPYQLWVNCEEGAMQVWLTEKQEANMARWGTSGTL